MHLTPPPPAAGDDEGNGPGRDDRHPRPRNGHRDDVPGDVPGDVPDDIHIPDDISELADDVAAYHAELQSLRRRELISKILPGLRPAPADRPAHRSRPTPSVIIAVLLIIISALGAMVPLVLAHPRPPAPARPLPLAATTAQLGAVGSVLPDITLRAAHGSRVASDLRPALIVLLPTACDCAKAVHDIVGQAHEGNPVPTYLLAPEADSPALNELTRAPEAAGGRALGFGDPDGSLARLVGADPQQPTLLLVAADGRLVQPPRVFAPGDRLEGWLGALPLR
ncbi:hypothetical protein [Frankia sp. CiP3]|uniref:hypothetical protein n=1 Tax=Frankia sp. CiP3 TaxID=2880971 RepID=UPI001EF588DA|nr:hypothetical protein [Frankia sp. CiP3]